MDSTNDPAKTKDWRRSVLRWAAPEVLMGERYLLQSDVYSFGSVCLEVQYSLNYLFGSNVN